MDEILNNYISFDNYDTFFLNHNKHIISFLKNLDKTKLTNIILYGLNGSGKKTLLYSLFDYKDKIKNINYIKINNKDINILYYTYKNIFELDINDFGLYKINIFRSFIKDLIFIKNVKNEKKIIILHNINKLTFDDQYILRKIIEDYTNNVTFILLSETINNIMEPIMSRCITLRINPITTEIIIEKIKLLETINNVLLDKEKIEFIISNCNLSLKKCIILFKEIINNDYDIVKKIHSKTNKNYLSIINNLKNKNINHAKLEQDIYGLLIIYKIKAHDIIFDIYNIFFKDNEQVVDLIFEYNKLLTYSKKDIIYLQNFFIDLKKYIVN